MYSYVLYSGCTLASTLSLVRITWQGSLDQYPYPIAHDSGAEERSLWGRVPESSGNQEEEWRQSNEEPPTAQESRQSKEAPPTSQESRQSKEEPESEFDSEFDSGKRELKRLHRQESSERSNSNFMPGPSTEARLHRQRAAVEHRHGQQAAVEGPGINSQK